MKLKVGDKLIVIAGANKGKIGKLNKILKQDNKVIVEGVNLVKKHNKPNGKDQTGGIVEFEAPIHISNVMLVDSKTGKGTRKRTEEKKEVKKVTKTKAEPKKEIKQEVKKKTKTKTEPKKEIKKEEKKVAKVKKVTKEKAEPKQDTKVSKKTNKKNSK